MKIVKIVVILLLISLLGIVTYQGSLDLTTAEYIANGYKYSEYDEDWTPTKDKAIIIIHGLMDGAMYEASTDGVKSEKGYWNGDIGSIISSAKALLTSNIDCYPTLKVRVGNMKDNAPYDANGILKDCYDYFKASKYSQSHDVLCWQYDWRQHLDGAALALDRFILRSGYKKVILVGHSMGCVVSSRYLALGEMQRSKVELFIPFGGPMLGAVDASAFMYDKVEGMSTESLMSTFVDLTKVLKLNFAECARNFTTAYHLMVSKQYFSSPCYTGNETCYKLDGKYISYAEYMNYITSQD